METTPLTVCFCQPVASIISGSVAPFARFIIAMTSAFLLLRSAESPAFLVGFAFFVALVFFAGFAPFRAFVGFGASGFSLAWPLAASGWIAFHIRATAFLRSANLLTSALPGMLFQMSTNRLSGQSADTLASAAWSRNSLRLNHRPARLPRRWRIR